MIQKTRELIFDYLKRNGEATAAELSGSLSLTKANIQYHLQKMERDRLVIVELLRNVEKRGRPVKLYKPDRGALKNNYRGLCEVLIKEINGAGTEEGRESERWVAFGQKIALEMRLSGLTPQRIRQMIHYLNRHHYEASWVAHLSGPQIIIRNCPYADLVEEFPQLCIMDVEMVRSALAAESIRLEKSTRADDRIPVCQMRLVLSKPS